MNNSQVAHLWANQAKPSARGSNFYFDGPALYSYGRHFCVARFISNKRGKRAALLNSDSYSISTSRHQYMARRVLASDVVKFSVPGASARHEDNRARYRDILAAAMARIPGRRTEQGICHDIGDARSAVENYNEYSAFFQLRGRLKLPELSAADEERRTRYAANAAKREERERVKWEAGAPERARQEAARLQEAAERDAKAREEFRAGGRRGWHIGGPCMLRLNGDTFETSQGADVPRADGVAMLAFISARLREGGTFETVENEGPRAGGFMLRKISADQVTIGCHDIPMTECAAMAALVGVEWPA